MTDRWEWTPDDALAPLEWAYAARDEDEDWDEEDWDDDLDEDEDWDDDLDDDEDWDDEDDEEWGEWEEDDGFAARRRARRPGRT